LKLKRGTEIDIKIVAKIRLSFLKIQCRSDMVACYSVLSFSVKDATGRDDEQQIRNPFTSCRVGFPNFELDEIEGIKEQLTKKGLSPVLGNFLHVWVPRFLWYQRARSDGEAPK